jgi:hypothetical protein
MDKLLHDHLGDGSLPRRLWEKRMELPEDIRLKIEASTYKETIVDVVDRLQKEGGGDNPTILTRGVEEYGPHRLFAALQRRVRFQWNCGRESPRETFSLINI